MPPGAVKELSFRELIIMFDSYMLEEWDKISLVACQTAHVETLLFNIHSKKPIPFPLQTDYHPYRKREEKQKKDVKAMFAAFREVARSFNKGAVP